ncbi:MAG: hypothetical protein NZ908_02480 [Candidatus Micrarchaeota archaeon]|nr:hypothetical protein [Candidatus Micrarchaeota archaeon]
MEVFLTAEDGGGGAQINNQKAHTFYLEKTDELDKHLIRENGKLLLGLHDGQKVGLKEGDIIAKTPEGKQFTIIRGPSPSAVSDLIERGYQVYIYHNRSIYKFSREPVNNEFLTWENGKISEITLGKRNEQPYQEYRRDDRESYGSGGTTVLESYKSLSFSQRLETYGAARKLGRGKANLNDPGYSNLVEHVKQMRSGGMSEREILEQYFGKQHGEVLYDLYNQQKGLFKDLDFSKWAAAIVYLTRNPEALKNISDSQKPPENQTNNQQNQTQQPNSGQRNNQTPLTQQFNSAQNQSITSEVVNLMVELERMEIGSGNIMLLTSAYNGLKRRYGDKINAQTYLEIVEKHWNPQRNFVDFYRSVLKEIHERFRDTTVEYNKPTTSSTTHSEESKSFTVSNPLNDETESFNKDELATTNNSVLYLRIGESGRIEVEGREVNFTVGRDLNGVYVDIRLPDEREKTHRMYILMKPQPNVKELQETPFGIIVDPVTGELKFEPILPDTKGKRYLIVANLKDDKRIAISLEKINL